MKLSIAARPVTASRGAATTNFNGNASIRRSKHSASGEATKSAATMPFIKGGHQERRKPGWVVREIFPWNNDDSRQHRCTKEEIVHECVINCNWGLIGIF